MTIISILKSNGAEYSGERITIDGRIITGDGPEAAEEFGNTIVKFLV